MAHIQDMQDKAGMLFDLLSAAAHLDNEGVRQCSITTLIGVSRDMAWTLCDELDVTKLPEGRSNG